MWKPADRIKYQAITDEWPTAEQARSSQLFSPIQIGPMRLPQRNLGARHGALALQQ